MRRIHAGLHYAIRALSVTGLGLVLLASGCAHRVPVEVPSTPAFALTADRVAVVASDRTCRDVADALVREINAHPGMQVDPRAPVRIQAVSCGRSLSADVLVDNERRRVSLTGRAHALLAVIDSRGVQAHLLGSAQNDDLGAWGERDLLGRGRAVDHSLSALVARDLATQLNPLPTLAHRRVYPRAREGSARRLRSDAVAAEVQGDLRGAHRLALAAYHEHPSPSAGAYVRELERRLAFVPPP